MITVEEIYEQCMEELKRVDHLIYVSLKYTRTCDVFKNVIRRMIEAIDFSLTALCKKLEQEKKITEVPQAAKPKCELLKQYHNDEKIVELVDFYLFLRQIDRAEFSRSSEFRRHVAMSCVVEGEEIMINIDIITAYYKKIRGLIEHIGELLSV